MTRLAVLAAVLAIAPRTAEACAVKHNDLAIVLGVAGGDVVTVRIALHLGDDGATSEWRATADLHAGARKIPIGSLDPHKPAAAELDRLIADARAEAARLAGFTPATRVSVADCSAKPSSTCGGLALEKDGTVLRAGSVRTALSPADARALIGVVRYTAGTMSIAVANVGTGSPKFADALRSCDGGCRDITTLHHGQQLDVVVVTR